MTLHEAILSRKQFRRPDKSWISVVRIGSTEVFKTGNAFSPTIEVTPEELEDELWEVREEEMYLNRREAEERIRTLFDGHNQTHETLSIEDVLDALLFPISK